MGLKIVRPTYSALWKAGLVSCGFANIKKPRNKQQDKTNQTNKVQDLEIRSDAARLGSQELLWREKEREMITKQALPLLVVWWLSFKVKLTKAICFTPKPNFLFPKRTFLQLYFTQSRCPRAVCRKATQGGPRQQSRIKLCRHSAAPGKEI